MAKITSFLTSSFLVLISLIIASIVGEFVVRALGHHGVPEQVISNIVLTDDPTVNWRYNPGTVKYEGNVEYKYNSMGFRDIEHAKKGLPGTKRIVVIGDSVTDGYGVKFDDIFSRILQSSLRDTAEVINIAQGGMNTEQEIHLLKLYGIQLEPDIVILNYVLNDFDAGSAISKKKENTNTGNNKKKTKDNTIGLLGGISVDPEVKRLLKRSALIYFIKERLENIKGLITGDVVLTQDYFTRIWRDPNNRKQVANSIEELGVLGKKNNFQAYVLIWPILDNFDNYRYKDIHEWLATEAKGNNLHVIDLLEYYSVYSYRKLQVTSEDNVHPNRKGHELAVAAFLTGYDRDGHR